MSRCRWLVVGAESPQIEVSCSWITSRAGDIRAKGLHGEEIEICRVGSLVDGLEELERENAEIVFVCLESLDRRGLGTLQHLATRTPSVATIALAEFGLEPSLIAELREEAFAAGAQEVIAREETSAEELVQKVVGALAREHFRDSIVEAKNVAERATREKSAFLASMSHEIRTPMTAILGFSEELLAERVSEEERLELASTIRSSGQHLLHIVNDILDFSKIESGKIEVERISFSPHELVRSTCDLVEAQAKEKGIDFDCVFVNDLPRTIESDPTRLKQILLNLLSNAIKFTDEGSVLVMVVFVEDGEPSIEISVFDSGIGVAAERLEKIFEPFEQEDSTTTRRYGGTGLGLAISKRLARLLGGDLVAWSEEGGGTAFRVSVPVGSGVSGPLVGDERMPARERAAVDFRSGESIPSRVLVVDDTPMNRKLVRRMLERVGSHVTTCDNGQKAIDAVRRASEENQTFDLILMDMQMPVLDGFEATRRLRRLGCDIPIVALTASCLPEDQRHCYEAGCTDFLSKPIDRSTLLRKVAEFCAQS